MSSTTEPEGAGFPWVKWVVLPLALTLAIAGSAAAAVIWAMSRDSGAGEAEDACKDRTEAALKAPSTAEWGDFSATELTEGRYRVTGYVDAENSFGAQLRTNVTCVVDNGRVDEYEHRP